MEEKAIRYRTDIAVGPHPEGMQARVGNHASSVERVVNGISASRRDARLVERVGEVVSRIPKGCKLSGWNDH